MASLFDQTLDAILSPETDLDERLIQGLSDPTKAQATAFRRQIAGCAAALRQELFRRMVDLAERRFEMDFVLLFRGSLDDDDPVVRRLCIEGLWEDARPDLARRLVHRLVDDTDPRVRAAAATALGRFVYLGECDEIESELAARIRVALEGVIMQAGEVEVVRRAVESVAFINDSRVRAIIEDAYEHDSQHMRESAVFAMGRSADSYWSDAVMQELQAPLPGMRYEAARAAGEMLLRSAVGPLVELLDDMDAEVRTMAVWALGQIGGKRARAALERLLNGSDEALAAAAEDALSEIEFASGDLDLLVHESPADAPFFDDDGAMDNSGGDEPSDDWEDDVLRIP